MQVLKFGGTSVGSATRMKEVFQIITSDDQQKIVVLSAVSGTTNSLLGLVQLLSEKKPDQAVDHIDSLKRQYDQLVDELYHDQEIREQGQLFIAEKFEMLREFSRKKFDIADEKVIVA